MKKNILLVWDRMGDYHRARWKALQDEFPDRKIFAADLGGSDNLYEWNTTSGNPLYILLSEKKPDKFDFRRFIKFIRTLSDQQIGTVCISGYGRIEYLIFILYSKLSGRKIILFAESWYPSGFFIDKLKSLFLRYMNAGFLVSGSRAYAHFADRLKISKQKIKVGYSVVDNMHFGKPHNHSAVFNKHLLCVARFAHEKNLKTLVAAFLESCLPGENWKLSIVGSGPLKAELENLAAGNVNINLMPWKPYEELPGVYHNADIFILLSTFEPWGLVVNEAMAAGLPVILSKAVGCVPDLLVDGHNGFLFDGDHSSLVILLDKINDIPPEKLIGMGEKSKEMINQFALKTFSCNLKYLIEIIN